MNTPPSPPSDRGGARFAPIIVERALTLTQPWATLVAIGAKEWETRSWRTSYRGWIAIHAAKGFPKECRRLCAELPFRRALSVAGYDSDIDLPTSKIIAVAYIENCVSTNEWRPHGQSDERAFGDYSDNRYAWELSNVQRIDPIEAKGALSIWRMKNPILIAASQAAAKEGLDG